MPQTSSQANPYRDSANVDWSAYLRYRPPYTEAFYNIIWNYHKGRYSHAHDAGAGIGTVAHDLARRFSSVTASDVSENAIAKANQFLAKDRNVHAIVAKAEDMGQHTEEQSLDLVTVAQTVHWIDHRAVVQAATRCLRPGGTLAIWSYAGIFIMDNTEANVILRKIWTTFYESLPKDGSFDDASRVLDSMLDVIDLSDERLADVTRIKWFANEDIRRPSGRDWESKVGDNDRVVNTEAGKGDGLWETKYSYQDIKDFFETLVPRVLTDRHALWEDLERAIGADVV